MITKEYGRFFGVCDICDDATPLFDTWCQVRSYMTEDGWLNKKNDETNEWENYCPVCGEIDAGADFYDYEAKYITDTSTSYIPARISEEAQEQVRELAVKGYKAIGCQGLSRVDFFVCYDDERIVFNEINTLPGFTSISMYPKLFAASGIPYAQLIDQLLELAMEAGV